MELPRRVSLDGILDVISPEEYRNNLELYGNTRTAIEMQEDGITYILPHRKQTDDRPGIYQAGLVSFTKFPETEEEKQTYAKDNLTIIDYADVDNITGFLNKQQQLRDIESEILTDIDNVYTPVIDYELDTPEMKALKEAITMKQCDIDKYSKRFGSNYLNDKRGLKGHDITMKKLIRICNGLDMEVELIIRDTNPNVANPMGGEVRAIITSGGNTDE